MSKNSMRIVHLSDIHFEISAGRSYSDDQGLTAARNLIMSGDRERYIQSTFVVVAGDIILSGRRAQPEVATEFLHDLATRLDIPFNHILCVPGNHDVPIGNVSNSIGRENSGRLLSLQSSNSYSPSFSESSLRVFEEEKLAFLHINTPSEASYSRGPLEFHNLRKSLRSRELSGYMLVAVFHRRSAGPSSLLDFHDNSTEMLQFLDEWAVNLVLHSNTNSMENLIVRQGSSGVQVHTLSESSHFQPFVRNGFDCWSISKVDEELLFEPSAYVGNASEFYKPASGGVRIHVDSFARERPIFVQTGLSSRPLSKRKISELGKQLAEMSPQSLDLVLSSMYLSMEDFSADGSISRWEIVHSLITLASDRGNLPRLEALTRRHSLRAGDLRSKIFLLHSARDKVVAAGMANVVRELGYSVWFDDWDIQPDESVSDSVTQGMLDSDVLLILATETTFQSTNIWRELQLWNSLNELNRVLIVTIGDVLTPAELKHLLSFTASDPMVIFDDDWKLNLQLYLAKTTIDSDGRKSFDPDAR